ncbi:MAG: AzlD domain-containing protein [Gammaproteobacteria bacterium]|nr:AzlD domain-containing protein [Gammaproteobacteria bacterium]
MKIWLVILGAGAITFALRLSFLYLHGRARVPTWFTRSLRYVPAAVLAAIVLPGIAMPHGMIDMSFANPRLLAGIAAVVAAWWSGNGLVTMFVGMGSLWLLQLWF